MSEACKDPDPADIIAGALQISRAHAYELMAKALMQRIDYQVVYEFAWANNISYNEVAQMVRRAHMITIPLEVKT